MRRGRRRRSRSGKLAGALEAMKAAVLQSSGDASPSLRQAVASRAAATARAASAAGPHARIPDVLAAYIDKVARHAYKTTGEDIAALRAAGYSQDAIFELTVSAALGAGMARLERGLDALRRCRAAAPEGHARR